ncbi:L-rhamnose-proton symporter [Aquipluma nitroreducens]|uniref:L-rhamnose-proton symporter n=2 Tax=Aquipluma nitroreducens TaxID=2010828 RepID=A0A5K7S3G6_9BACT|nr:L-rhamnose-proton symporter [Aquipluma nitroreducens]
MTYTKKWDWAHKWFAFSLLAMLVLNWIIAFGSISNLSGIILQIPSSLLFVVMLFGLGWGIGAILFGKGMDILGMALGYPIIMGINAAAGTIIPALIFSPGIFFQTRGKLIIAGAILTVAGIILCAKASSIKAPSESTTNSKQLGKGLIIAVIAGFTSCLPNLGAAFSGQITSIALNSGVNSILAGNVVWSLFFSSGAIINAGYCLFLINRTKSIKSFFNEHKAINWILMLAMSVMWIGSFYFYGIGCSMLGDYGLIIGWPLLITLSIVVGNLWGLYRGEWKEASAKSKRILNIGLLILIGSIVLTAMSNKF